MQSKSTSGVPARDRFNIAPYSTGRVGASLTATTMEPVTVLEAGALRSLHGSTTCHRHAFHTRHLTKCMQLILINPHRTSIICGSVRSNIARGAGALWPRQEEGLRADRDQLGHTERRAALRPRVLNYFCLLHIFTVIFVVC